MKISIEKIKIAERIRKEVNRVDELAANIRSHGLITPIAVMQLECGEYQLLAGLRRIRAMEINGENEIDAKVFPASDAEAALKIEYSENEQREPFTYSEKMEYGAIIAEIEKAKAAERQTEGQALGGMSGGRGRPKRDSIRDQGPTSYEEAKEQKKQTRDRIGEKIGMSGKQYERAKYIAANAPREMIDELDRGERTIRGTYDELRSKEKTDKPPAQDICMRTESKSQPGLSAPKLPVAKGALPKDYMSRREQEATGNIQEFEGLTPEGKIKELQRQLKDQRVRAADAEYNLSREKELRQNEMYHYNATIEMLNKQLEAANTRITELEERYEPNRHTI